MLSTYELALVLTSAAEEKSLLTPIKKIVEKNGGKISKEDSWGKKPLSYPIKKQTEGTYVFLQMEIDGISVKNLSNTLKTHESVLRYLILTPFVSKKKASEKLKEAVVVTTEKKVKSTKSVKKEK